MGFWAIKKNIHSISGTAKGIKLEISANVEGDIELNERAICASRL